MRLGPGRTHDATGRRLRERRVPTGKVKRPTARDLIWLDKLQRHGPLPSSYLHAYGTSRPCVPASMDGTTLKPALPPCTRAVLFAAGS
ncbi:MAG: hypothetical protein AB7N54_08600 [Alphaproteobacteria bacterium]